MKQLYIKQKVFKITDHYPITDEEGTPVYQVDEDFRFFKKMFRVTRPDGSPAFSIEKQITFLRPLFAVSFPDGRELEIRSRFTFLKKVIDIGPESEGLILRGDFWNHSFQVLRFERRIGEIRKKWLSWGDSYELDIEDPHYEELFLAVVLAVDAILDAEEASAASSSH